MPTCSVLAAFAMKVFILVIAVNCALFFRGAYLLDESFDEIQREEDKLPHYFKYDGIRRVAKLTKDHFNKTLKASRKLVVLFCSSEELSSRFQSVCNRIQDSIQVIESQMGNEEVFSFDINRDIFTFGIIYFMGIIIWILYVFISCCIERFLHHVTPQEVLNSRKSRKFFSETSVDMSDENRK